MCGIVGIISPDPGKFSISLIQKMTQALSHRGPDGESSWANPSGHVLFGHRRLAIIDLSENGSQAMHYGNRYTIVYNGEIYNYVELKETLLKKGYVFKSHSDTEVILAAYDCYKERCLEMFDGMFAFTIWDEELKTIFAARDRFGEKPLYYSYDDSSNHLWFASEVKALVAGGIQAPINDEKLLMFLGLGQTENPQDAEGTFYQNVRQLPPAHFLIYRPLEKKLLVKEYWKLDKEKQVSISKENAIKRFRELLTTSVARRLRSDVPLGTSLSGGLDSSALVATIHGLTNMSGALKTFSAVFPGFEKDESFFIRSVTESFALEQRSVTPTPEEFVRDFQKLLYHHEAPVSSASVYVQYRVFELAKENNIKVLLDGQGADEVLAGYTKYIHWHLQELLNSYRFSDFNSEKKAFIANKIPFQWSWKNYASAFAPHLSKNTLEEKELNTIRRNDDMNKDFVHQNLNKDFVQKPYVSKLNDILYFNTFRSGLSELLRYADRNSMAHGREVRLPYLNHELVEFIFSLPSSFKIHNGWTKWILRKSVEEMLPAEIVWRTDKVGFEPPQKSWMKNDRIQDYIYESKKNLVTRRILNSSVLSKKNQPHDAYAADNLDWRYLVAGQLVK
jgi:asparagine synthase (glutamine-hydrolysing)